MTAGAWAEGWPMPVSHRRRLGRALLAFGAVGLALLVAVGGLVLASLGAVGDLAAGYDAQRSRAVELIGPSAAALRRAADASSDATTSLAASVTAARDGSALMGDLARSMDGLAASAGVEVFGTRPFGGIAGSFSDVARRARDLEASLGATGAALETNVRDGALVADDLRALADRMDALAAAVGAPAERPGGAPGARTDPGPALGVDAARIVVLGLLAWLATPALGSLWLGWRWARTRPAGG